MNSSTYPKKNDIYPEASLNINNTSPSIKKSKSKKRTPKIDKVTLIKTSRPLAEKAFDQEITATYLYEQFIKIEGVLIHQYLKKHNIKIEIDPEAIINQIELTLSELCSDYLNSTLNLFSHSVDSIKIINKDRDNIRDILNELSVKKGHIFNMHSEINDWKIYATDILAQFKKIAFTEENDLKNFITDYKEMLNTFLNIIDVFKKGDYFNIKIKQEKLEFLVKYFNHYSELLSQNEKIKNALDKARCDVEFIDSAAYNANAKKLEEYSYTLKSSIRKIETSLRKLKPIEQLTLKESINQFKEVTHLSEKLQALRTKYTPYITNEAETKNISDIKKYYEKVYGLFQLHQEKFKEITLILEKINKEIAEILSLNTDKALPTLHEVYSWQRDINLNLIDPLTKRIEENIKASHAIDDKIDAIVSQLEELKDTKLALNYDSEYVKNFYVYDRSYSSFNEKLRETLVKELAEKLNSFNKRHYDILLHVKNLLLQNAENAAIYQEIEPFISLLEKEDTKDEYKNFIKFYNDRRDQFVNKYYLEIANEIKLHDSALKDKIIDHINQQLSNNNLDKAAITDYIYVQYLQSTRQAYNFLINDFYSKKLEIDIINIKSRNVKDFEIQLNEIRFNYRKYWFLSQLQLLSLDLYDLKEDFKATGENFFAANQETLGDAALIENLKEIKKTYQEHGKYIYTSFNNENSIMDPSFSKEDQNTFKPSIEEYKNAEETNNMANAHVIENLNSLHDEINKMRDEIEEQYQENFYREASTYVKNAQKQPANVSANELLISLNEIKINYKKLSVIKNAICQYEEYLNKEICETSKKLKSKKFIVSKLKCLAEQKIESSQEKDNKDSLTAKESLDLLGNEIKCNQVKVTLCAHRDRVGANLLSFIAKTIYNKTLSFIGNIFHTEFRKSSYGFTLFSKISDQLPLNNETLDENKKSLLCSR